MKQSELNASHHIKAVASVLVGGFTVIALFVWIHQETTGWVSLWSTRVALAAVVVTTLYLGAELLQVYLHIHRRRKNNQQARRQAAAVAVSGRRALREGTREFMLFLEDQYSWVLEMPELDQERRALLWYRDITSRWAKENERFHRLRANDDCAVVDQELGLDLVERMFAIWDRRTQLYQYAIAWSDPAERAREILRIGRLIRQIQVEETVEQQRFAERLQAQLASQAQTTENSDRPEAPWGPRPVQADDITGEVLKEFEPDADIEEAGG